MIQINHRAKPNHQISKANCRRALQIMSVQVTSVPTAYSLPAEILCDCLRTDLVRLVFLIFVLVVQSQRTFFVDVGRSDGQSNRVNRDVLGRVSDLLQSLVSPVLTIIIVYKTLHTQADQQRRTENNRRKETHLTAGAREPRGTMANPAARTAADCTNAAAIRVPTGNASMASVPMSKTRKQTQSVKLRRESEFQVS